jgi:hypothetical protein
VTTTRARYPLVLLADRLGITLGQVGGHQPDQLPSGHAELMARLHISRATATRWARHGIPDRHADRAACAAGYHPATIWPEWENAVDGEDDDWYADDPPIDTLDDPRPIGAAA